MNDNKIVYKNSDPLLDELLGDKVVTGSSIRIDGLRQTGRSTLLLGMIDSLFSDLDDLEDEVPSDSIVLYYTHDEDLTIFINEAVRYDATLQNMTVGNAIRNPNEIVKSVDESIAMGLNPIAVCIDDLDSSLLSSSMLTFKKFFSDRGIILIYTTARKVMFDEVNIVMETKTLDTQPVKSCKMTYGLTIKKGGR